MNKQVLLIGAVVVVLAIGAYLLLVRPQTQPVTQDITTPKETETDSSIEFTVEGSSNLRFTPNELRVKEGDKVKITFKNTGGTHNFVIDELDVKTKVINTGQQEIVEFVADKKGSFAFYCSIPGHRAAGMKGTLIVE